MQNFKFTIDPHNIRIFNNTFFRDLRGDYWTTWKKENFKKIIFNHDKFSISKKNVFRGFHGDYKTTKIVTCIFGKVFLAIINYNKKSKNYLMTRSLVLDENKKQSIIIPPKFLSAIICLSDKCVFHYKLSYKGKYFNIKDQISLNWKSKIAKFKWPISPKKFILSKRDK
jgi:dTDP-4-dehydrorhamnose 3,5-epimerase